MSSLQKPSPRAGASSTYLNSQTYLEMLPYHILVIDDEELIRLQLQRLYTQNGYTVSLAASAEAGIEQLRQGDIGVNPIGWTVTGLK